MASLPDFLTGTWLQRYHQGFEGEGVGYFGKAPIPPVRIPYLFTKQYVRISVDSIQKKDTWTYGAKIYQTITTQLGFEDVTKEFTVELGKPEIIDMLLFPDGYNLKLRFPTWLKDVDIVVHEFQGITVEPDSPFILSI